MSRRLLLLPILLIPIAACGSDSGPDSSADSVVDAEPIEVTGNLTYLPRIALVPGGTATVTLEDVSIADAAAPVVAEQTIELDDQQIPIPFELSVDPADLEPNGMYSVRAQITGPEGSLDWTTDTVYPVDPQAGSVELGDLVLVQVVPTDADENASPLTGSWTVTEIDGSAVPEATAATLIFGTDGSLSGTTGCNSYNTGVEIDGDQLVVGDIAATMMACEGEVATQEAAFLAILDDSPTFELVDTNVVLLIEGAAGSTLSARR